MGALRQGFGEQISPPSGAGFSAATSVASTQIGGLSSRQILFGSTAGGIAQTPAFIIDTTNLRIEAVASAAANVGYEFRIEGGEPVGSLFRAGAAGAFIGNAALGDMGFRAMGNAFLFGVSTAAGLAPALASIIISTNTYVGIFTTAPAGPLQVNSTAGAVGLTVNSSGHVGVGTTAPTDPLHVVGSARICSAANATFSVFGAAGTTQASSYTTAAITSARTFPSSFDGTTVSTLAFTGGLADRVNALTTAFLALLRVTETVAKDLGVGGAGYGWLR